MTRNGVRCWMTLVLAAWIAGAAPPVGRPAEAWGDSLGTVTESGEHGGAAGAGETGGGEEPAEAGPPFAMPPLGEALLDSLHNKLVHFPIVLTLVATALLLLGRRRPELETIGFWLVWIAALSTLAAYFSGQAAEEAFEHGPKEWLVEIHEKQGIALGIGQALWVLALLRAGTRRWAWLLGLALSVMVGASGFIGGLVAHAK